MVQPVKTNASEGFEQFLVSHGFVTPEALEELHARVQQTGLSLPQELINQKIMDEENLAQARAAFFNIPYTDLRKVQVVSEILNLIPQESMNFYNFVPFELQEHTLKVAIVDPSNLSALEALEFLGQKQNLQVQLYLASESSVDIVMGRKKNLKRVAEQALKDIQVKEDEEKKATSRN